MRPSAKSIAVPISIPVLFATLLLAAFAQGNVNVHGGTGALALLSVISGVAVVIWELVAVPWAVATLVKNAQLRTRVNIAVVGLGVLYLLAAYLVYLYLLRTGLSHGQ